MMFIIGYVLVSKLSLSPTLEISGQVGKPSIITGLVDE